jgi:hypothetical protein
MATFTKINDWVEYMSEGANIGSDTFKAALSNTAPASEASNPTADGNGVIANVTTVSVANLDTVTLTSGTASQTSGTQTLDFADLVMTASGAVGPFQYVYIYDDTLAGDPLVCVFDYGSAVTMAASETFTITFDAAGLFTVA